MPAFIARAWQALHGGFVVLALCSLAVMLFTGIAAAATPAGTTITNTAQVRWGVGAGTLVASAQSQITVATYTLGSDLVLSMAGPAQVASGSNMTWKAVVSNAGPSAASGAQVIVALPPGVTGISAGCAVLTSGTCGTVTVGAMTPAGTQVTITMPSLPVGGSVEITLRGTAPATPGNLNTLAQASTPALVDPVSTNNVATAQTQVLAGAPNTGSLSGHVWLDTNHDRLRGSGEFLFQGFTIRVYDAAGTTVVRQSVTDALGAYTIAGLPAGVDYQLEFRDPAGNAVFGLPVTAETGGTGFASTNACGNMPETTAPNIVMPVPGGSCYSLTTNGSTAQVQRAGRILIRLQPGDNIIEQSLPLDPAGVVYDAVTRLPVAGATVTFTGPAGFDPAIHLIGGVANQAQVTGASGFYQFLLVGGAPAGTYTLTVTGPPGYVSPSALLPAAGTLDPTGLGFGGVFPVQAQAVPPTGPQPTIYHLTFDLALGDPNVVNNHIPIDPIGVPGGTLVLRKVGNKSVAAVGDFVQYQLSLSNPGAVPVTGISVSDRLPPGFRYRAGTAQINAVASANPAISADGRTLTFNIGALAGGAALEIRYVTEITAGTTLGDAINSASAAGAGGASSLVARATVNVKEDLFRSRSILLGRVIELSGPKSAAAGLDLCGPERFFGKGVEGARIFMEDGAYVRTDKDGKWHIEGVKPGTHVVQLDAKSLPEGYEPVLCEGNTRHAGRAYSQFVNTRGGTLWRADFYVRNTGRSSIEHEAGHRLLVTPVTTGARIMLELKGITTDVRNTSMTIVLPQGLAYSTGSARMNSAAAEPEVNGNLLVFRAGDADGIWRKVLEFEVTGTMDAGATVQGISQFQSADGETRRLPQVSVVLTLPAAADQLPLSDQQIIQYKQLVKAAAPKPEVPAATASGSAAAPSASNLNIYAPGADKFDAAWLAAAEPGLEVVYPPENFIPGINATKVIIKHDQAHKITLSMNGVPAHALNFDGNEQNPDKALTLARWGGVGLQDGTNKIVVIAVDASGREVGRAERMLHYSGAGVEGRFVSDASTLVADGRTAPVIAIRIFDREGKPARHGTEGALSISAPYQSLEVMQRQNARPLLGDIGNQARWRVTEDGLALIRLQPTTTAGEVVLTFNFPGRAPQLLRAWLKPELREWILVGLGEGTIGERKLSGGVENLPSNLVDDKLWKDGRVAFYAKGQVKGEFLMTVAYDTDKERRRIGGNQGDRLGQTLDRNQYYTIYGDATSVQYDAASTRKLYLKIEKDQLYALFGDYDTGMSVTELSRYSRTLNGVKSEFRGQNVSYTAFAAQTAQAFVKDELRPDGTSGLYRLTRRNILPNSDKIVLETRDRFRNEVILKSEPLSRGMDYEIDYTLGTVFFRKAVTEKDRNFNPVYIIADYESADPMQDERLTGGGRAALRTSDGKQEIGLSAVHEGTIGARGDLSGVDATYQINDKTRVRAELAQSRREARGSRVEGGAYLVEARRQDENVAATVYLRGQEGGFGLGQQAAAGAGTTKVGGDVSVKISQDLRLNALATHERVDNAGAQADRTRVEGRANYVQPDYSAYAGGRAVRDHTAAGETLASNQVVAGGNRKLMDGRLNLRMDSELSIAGNNGSADFPHRLRVGVDYKLTEKISVFVDQELTYGARENTDTTRFGIKSRLWEGGESANSLNLRQTPDGPLVSSTSSMTQTVRVSSELTVNAGMDRTSTLRKPGTTPLNSNVPVAQGVNATGGAASQSTLPPTGLAAAPIEDYTALFAGATWNRGPWGLTARGEYRHGTTTDRINLVGSVHRDLKSGEALAVTALYNSTSGGPVGDNKGFNLRLSYALRPPDSLWIVLNRLDYVQDESATAGGSRSRRLVNNTGINHQYNRRTQIALQYGAKYVFDTFDHASASGFTDLYGAEARYDLGSQFDIGVHASLLNSWQTRVLTSSYGLSVGHSPVTNLWLGLGYNFAGFRDRDFTAAHATAKGWHLYFRLKADQGEKDTASRRKLMFEEVNR
ncbi:MAG: DUF11 domain-containing protein [Burkholderiales bacterium]|nr:DUF11 domain-containing protein [Burkholderiales bacterium]